jgi:hypothetical protein
MRRFLFLLMMTIAIVAKSQLGAILVVGYQEDGTESACIRMDEVYDFLTSKGVKCWKFYSDEARWSEIVKVSPEANFFFYMGHGTHLGDSSGYGGLCIRGYISSEQIRKELKLRKKSVIVMQSVCGASGSSASDNFDIGLDEARKRVLSYSRPFFDIGAKVYYSDNFSNGALSFTKNFFDGKSPGYIWNKKVNFLLTKELEQCFLKYTLLLSSIKPHKATVTRYVTTNGKTKIETLTSFKTWSIAFFGDEGFTLNRMSN